MHVTRVAPQQGIEDSWAPAKRDGASFLAQSGRLKGLHRPAPRPGARSQSDRDRQARRRAVGERLELRRVAARVRHERALGHHAEPDDERHRQSGLLAGRIRRRAVQFDPRQALFFPEKRPFFLDGIEQFATPNNLIYTRRVVAPLAAAKLTGKVSGRTNLAFLSAVDDASLSASGERPSGVQHPARAAGRRRQVEGGAGLHRSHRRRLARTASIGSDARLGLEGHLQPDAAGRGEPHRRSATQRSRRRCGRARFARAGRRFGMRYTVRGVDPDFRAAAGFISRTGIASGNFNHQLITYGKPGSVLERWSSDVVVDGTWQYDELDGRPRVAGSQAALQQQLHACAAAGASAARCCSRRSATTSRSTPTTCSAGQGANGLEFTPVSRTARGCRISTTCCRAVTPQRGGVEFDALVLWGKDENFYEWSSADIIFLNVGAAWKPTDKLRVDARYQLQSFRRRTDDSIVGIRRIPRLKVEYQIARPIFVRVVGEYNSDWQDDLRDDSRTNLPIYILNRATGAIRSRREGIRRSRSAPTGCSRISRRRAPCCSPDTAIRSRTSTKIRARRACAARSTVSS